MTMEPVLNKEQSKVEKSKVSGNLYYPQALQKNYRDIHQRFPDNIDCMRFLVRLSTDMGKEAQEYSLYLQKVEKAREAKRQVREENDTVESGN